MTEEDAMTRVTEFVNSGGLLTVQSRVALDGKCRGVSNLFFLFHICKIFLRSKHQTIAI